MSHEQKMFNFFSHLVEYWLVEKDSYQRQKNLTTITEGINTKAGQPNPTYTPEKKGLFKGFL